MRIATYLLSVLVLFLASSPSHAQPVPAPAPAPGQVIETYDFKKLERLAPRFRSFYVTWGTTEKPEFKRYIETVQPAVVQAGWYGGMFHGYVDLKTSTGYPMQLPVSGLEACLEQWRTLHALVKANNGKSIAHFTVTNVIKGPEKDDLKNPGNFADWYSYTWPANLLGVKPSPSYQDLLARDSTGKPLVRSHYVQYHGLCINNPATRKMLTSMLRVAIDNGVDGVMTCYNYRWDCSCEHCQASFKAYLKDNYTPQELKTHFKIDDLDATKFDYIPGQTPGYPADKDISPFTLASYQWSGIAYKKAWDEIFIVNGRAKKPDLILGQWNHIGNVGITEERSFLPASMWAKGENYLWYSGNHYNRDIKPVDAEGNPNPYYENDGWLNGLYMRALAGDKPYAIGRYDGVRTRVGLSETMALGGAGTGLYNNITDPAAFAVLENYTKFAKSHETDVLDTHIRAGKTSPVQPAMIADTCVIIPRQSAWAGKKQSFDTFRKVATSLVRRQYPVVFCSDENIRFANAAARANPTVLDAKNLDSEEFRVNGDLSAYRTIILPEVLALSDAQIKALERFLLTDPTHKLVIIGNMATLDNHDRPWAIAQHADSATRLAKLFSYYSQITTVKIGEIDAINWSQDCSRPFEIWTESTPGQRMPLAAENPLRVALYAHPNGRHVLHIVNYNRDVAQALTSKKANTDAELPIPTPPLWIRIPRNGAIKTASFFNDDKSKPHLFTPDLNPDGTPESVNVTAESAQKGESYDWIKIGPVTVYRVLELY